MIHHDFNKAVVFTKFDQSLQRKYKHQNKENNSIKKLKNQTRSHIVIPNLQKKKFVYSFKKGCECDLTVMKNIPYDSFYMTS